MAHLNEHNYVESHAHKADRYLCQIARNGAEVIQHYGVKHLWQADKALRLGGSSQGSGRARGPTVTDVGPPVHRWVARRGTTHLLRDAQDSPGKIADDGCNRKPVSRLPLVAEHNLHPQAQNQRLPLILENCGRPLTQGHC